MNDDKYNKILHFIDTTIVVIIYNMYIFIYTVLMKNMR